MPNIFNETQDVVIVGGGPGGTACALSLLQRGIRPLIIERETFPRYRIGESLTGEMGKRLREFGLESFMCQEQDFPVKHGVKVWGKGGQNEFYIPVKAPDENNNLKPATTWQVRRDDFDKGLLEIARKRGAEFIQGQAVAPITQGERVKGLQVLMPDGRLYEIRAKMVVDASGPATFMASKSNLTGNVFRGNYDRQIAIYSQVKGAVRGGDCPPDDTIIFYKDKNQWGWFIPLSEDVVSIGIVVPTTYYRQKQQSKEAFFREEIFNLNPRLTERLENISIIKDVHATSNYSYKVDHFVGHGFLCVGDSHQFIDPIFSFGLHFAFHEGIYAADAIVPYLENGMDDLSPLLEYQQIAKSGQDIIQDFIDCFWDFPAAFLIMAHFQFREQFINLFAGRIYGEAQNMAAVKELQRLLSKKRNNPRDDGPVNSPKSPAASFSPQGSL